MIWIFDYDGNFEREVTRWQFDMALRALLTEGFTRVQAMYGIIAVEVA